MHFTTAPTSASVMGDEGGAFVKKVDDLIVKCTCNERSAGVKDREDFIYGHEGGNMMVFL